jgi:hypothetical protein
MESSSNETVWLVEVFPGNKKQVRNYTFKHDGRVVAKLPPGTSLLFQAGDGAREFQSWEEAMADIRNSLRETGKVLKEFFERFKVQTAG